MEHPNGTTPISVRVGIRKDPSAADIPYPRYMTPGAAGVDLHAAVDESVIVRMGEVKKIPTGLFLEIPTGFEGQVRARSGLALEKGLALVNAPGTIDSDYRGEVGVIVTCLSSTPMLIRRGMRIAQLVFAPIARVEFDVRESLDVTERGTGGFGSTGATALSNGAST